MTIGYDYFADGQLAGESGPGGHTGYVDDPLGRLTQVTDPTGGTFTIAYDAAGQISSLTRPNGVDDTYAYSASGDVTGIDSTLGSNEVNNEAYDVDPATGLVTSRTDQTGTTGYGYQADGALTTVTPPTGSTQPTETYGYDNFGDRTNGPATTDTSSFQAGGQITADTTNTYTWNADGNLVSKTDRSSGALTGYHYNTDHQLTSVDLPDGGTVNYAYDPLGRRVAETAPAGTTRWVWDRDNITATYSSTNSLVGTTVTLPTAALGTSSGQPAQVIEETTPTGTLWPLHDALGSVVALTDQTGTITDRIDYTAYGVPTGITDTNAISTFTGYQYDDATGLYYAHARYYNPTTGSYLTPDPVATNQYQPPTGTNPLQTKLTFNPTQLLNNNPYLYTNANPTNQTDPLGDIPGSEAAARFLCALGILAGPFLGGPLPLPGCGEQSIEAPAPPQPMSPPQPYRDFSNDAVEASVDDFLNPLGEAAEVQADISSYRIADSVFG